MASTLLDAAGIAKAVDDLAGEISAARQADCPLAMMGVRTRGATLAHRLAEKIAAATGQAVPVGELDITLYRDDLTQIGHSPVLKGTDIPFNVEGTEIILVDDVLFTGRTTRAALDALMSFGRPRYIRLAVLVDRGNRELPIRPDFVARQIETTPDQEVRVKLVETDGVDEVLLC